MLTIQAIHFLLFVAGLSVFRDNFIYINKARGRLILLHSTMTGKKIKLPSVQGICTHTRWVSAICSIVRRLHFVLYIVQSFIHWTFRGDIGALRPSG